MVKLSWDDTAREMAASLEDWSAWDATTSDGLDYLPWRADVARSITKLNDSTISKSL
jgi:hypothetical protein